MGHLKDRTTDSNGKTEESIYWIIYCIITPTISHSRVVQKSVFISDEYSQYLTFNVIIGSNNLTPHKEYSEQQQSNYQLIKSLHDSGLGYRKIAQHLNEKGIKTARGNSWVNTQVFSVIKKYKLRMDRIENVRQKKYPIEVGKFELQWLKN